MFLLILEVTACKSNEMTGDLSKVFKVAKKFLVGREMFCEEVLHLYFTKTSKDIPGL